MLEELTLAQCFALLATATVGRVGLSIDALPAILPVNYVLHDRAIVFRTVPGTKLDAATEGAVVAFGVDSYGDPAHPTGWSVLARGVAQEITDPTELAALQALPLVSWAFDGQADHFIRIKPTLLTGRRITPASHDD